MILAIYAIQENEDHPVFLFSLLGFCSTTRWWRWTSPGNYKESLGELECLCHWGWIWTKSANYIFPHPIHIIEYTQLQEIQGSDSWLQGGKRTFPWISKVSTKITLPIISTRQHVSTVQCPVELGVISWWSWWSWWSWAGKTKLTFKLDFPGNLWRAAFAILAMFKKKNLSTLHIKRKVD